MPIYPLNFRRDHIAFSPTLHPPDVARIAPGIFAMACGENYFGSDTHVRFDERGTGNAVKEVGLRPRAKATEQPPNPNSGAPAPDSITQRQNGRKLLIYCCPEP